MENAFDQIQVLVGATQWRFKSSHPHQILKDLDHFRHPFFGQRRRTVTIARDNAGENPRSRELCLLKTRQLESPNFHSLVPALDEKSSARGRFRTLRGGDGPGRNGRIGSMNAALLFTRPVLGRCFHGLR